MRAVLASRVSEHRAPYITQTPATQARIVMFRKMFPGLRADAAFVAEAKVFSEKQKMFSIFFQKHFVCATNVACACKQEIFFTFI